MRAGGFDLPVAALLCAAVLAFASGAKAWTKARVQGAAAEIDLHADGSADVSLTMELNILGGYLSELAIEGLDPDLELDPQRPASLTSEQGRLYLPRVKAEAGKPLLLYFPGRRAAPWRGIYRVELYYRTRLVPRSSRNAGPGTVRVSWTLPAWEEGLENVRIGVKAPPGSRPVAVPEDIAYAIAVDFEEGYQATSINWRRVRLPRTESWTVAFDVPRQALGMAPLQLQPVDAEIGEPSDRPERVGFWLAGCLTLLVLLKRRLVEGACARRSVRPVALLPCGPGAPGTLAIIVLAISAGLLFAERASLSLLLLCVLIALGLVRTFALQRAPLDGVWVAAGGAERKAALSVRLHDWFGAPAWMDATTPLGGALLLSAYLLLGMMLWSGTGEGSYLWALGTLLATPLFVTGTRLQLPPSPADTIARLEKAVDRFALNSALKPTEAWEALFFRQRRGAPLQARLRLRTDRVVTGLQRLELVPAQLFLPLARRDRTALLAVTVSGSPADRAAGEALAGALCLTGRQGGVNARLALLQGTGQAARESLVALLAADAPPGAGSAPGAVSRRAA